MACSHSELPKSQCGKCGNLVCGNCGAGHNTSVQH
jgi:hypothetical protein